MIHFIENHCGYKPVVKIMQEYTVDDLEIAGRLEIEEVYKNFTFILISDFKVMVLMGNGVKKRKKGLCKYRVHRYKKQELQT